MSLSILFKIENAAAPGLRALLGIEERRQTIHQAAADAVADQVRAHFIELENSRHKTATVLGAEPTGFWARMRGGVHVVATASDGTVAMPREVAQRYFGGTIRPGKGFTYIPLAAIAAAYGHRPKEFGFLEFGMAKNTFGKMQPALVDRARTNIRQVRDKRKGAADGATRIKAGETFKGGTVYFWLTTSVNQKPDKTVLPTVAEMQAAAALGAGEQIDALLKQAGGQN